MHNSSLYLHAQKLWIQCECLKMFQVSSVSFLNYCWKVWNTRVSIGFFWICSNSSFLIRSSIGLWISQAKPCPKHLNYKINLQSKKYQLKHSSDLTLTPQARPWRRLHLLHHNPTSSGLKPLHQSPWFQPLL